MMYDFECSGFSKVKRSSILQGGALALLLCSSVSQAQMEGSTDYPDSPSLGPSILAPFPSSSFTVFNTDVTAAGVGAMRNTAGPHTITLAGIGAGALTQAFLYWQGPTNTGNPAANANVFVDGNAVTGTNIGFSDDSCWGFVNSQAYAADITPIVQGKGDGAYALTGFGTGSVNTNGASIIAFFNDGDPTNNRDVVVLFGNDGNVASAFDGPGWSAGLAGINYVSGSASLGKHIADGQSFIDAALLVNGNVKVPQSNWVTGFSVPGVNNGPNGNGRLWDIIPVDVTADLGAAGPAPQSLSVSTGIASDCLALVVMAVDLPAAAAPGQEFRKDLTSGPDRDSDGAIDVVVPVGTEESDTYDFTITFVQDPDDPDDIVLLDAVPAEWDVIDSFASQMECEIFGANNKDNGKSATLIECFDPPASAQLWVEAETRCHGNRNNEKCRPTSCGALYLNDGAELWEYDPVTGELVGDEPVRSTDGICLAAVKDLDGVEGFEWDGSGDEDGDTLSDLEEACEIGTDPCLADTDGDGVRDDVDECPLEGPPNADLGEVLDPNGCIRQSQCSDSIDNDDDVAIDYPADLSCDSLVDDSEDSVDCACFSSSDIQALDIIECGANFPGFPDLAGVLATNGLACSGTNCAVVGPPSCGYSGPGGSAVVLDISAEVDSACRTIILANCANPNAPAILGPASETPFIR